MDLKVKAVIVRDGKYILLVVINKHWYKHFKTIWNRIRYSLGKDTILYMTEMYNRRNYEEY